MLSRSKKGMTLLELMMAMAIFALAGTAVMKAAGEHLRSLSFLEEQTIANIVANNRVAELHLEKTWPPKSNHSGKEEMANQTWYWRQQVVKTEDQNMRAVTVEVRLGEKSEYSVTSITAYVGKPNA